MLQRRGCSRSKLIADAPKVFGVAILHFISFIYLLLGILGLLDELQSEVLREAHDGRNLAFELAADLLHLLHHETACACQHIA